MPESQQWDSFFDPPAILTALGICHPIGTIVDVGCGYGTFTIAAARLGPQRVIALDVEEMLVQTLARRCAQEGLMNIEVQHRDVVTDGLGCESDDIAMVFLFNLLHCELPLPLLEAVHRALAPKGRVAVIHWRSDIPTPRGPSLAIRPTPEMMRAWLVETGFTVVVPTTVLPPYHYGLVGQKA